MSSRLIGANKSIRVKCSVILAYKRFNILRIIFI